MTTDSSRSLGASLPCNAHDDLSSARSSSISAAAAQSHRDSSRTTAADQNALVATLFASSAASPATSGDASAHLSRLAALRSGHSLTGPLDLVAHYVTTQRLYVVASSIGARYDFNRQRWRTVSTLRLEREGFSLAHQPHGAINDTLAPNAFALVGGRACAAADGSSGALRGHVDGVFESTCVDRSPLLRSYFASLMFISSMAVPRYHHVSIAAWHVIVSLGGYVADGSVSTAVECCARPVASENTAASRGRAVRDMSTARARFAAVEADEALWVIGGSDGQRRLRCADVRVVCACA